MEEPLDEPTDAPIAQKVKKPRSEAQVLAFQKAMDKRLLLASQKKIEEAKRIESGIKLAKPKPVPKPVKEEDEEEEEVRVVKKPKKKRIIYVESDSEEELVVKRKEKKQLPPPPPPPQEPIPKIEKPKPVYVFL
jgi:hypothetical protein